MRVQAISSMKAAISKPPLLWSNLAQRGDALPLLGPELLAASTRGYRGKRRWMDAKGRHPYHAGGADRRREGEPRGCPSWHARDPAREGEVA